MIQGVIFDMDGTLIDSEPIWQQEEVRLFNSLGLPITIRDIYQTKGLSSKDACAHWLQKLNDPSLSVIDVTTEYNSNVLSLLTEKVKPKAGAIEVIDFWKAQNLPIALASSSTKELVYAMVDKFNLGEYFELIVTGDDVTFTKPHPEIYILTTNELGIDPVYSVAFEDSLNGILSAKSARLKVVALLDEGQYRDTKYDIADLKLESFLNFGRSESEYLISLM